MRCSGDTYSTQETWCCSNNSSASSKVVENSRSTAAPAVHSTARLTVFYTYACRYRQMERENYCAHKLKLWSRQFKKQNRKFRAKKTACVSQADEHRCQKTHPLAWGGKTQAHACMQRPCFSSSILSNCLSEATCNWICQAPF